MNNTYDYLHRVRVEYDKGYILTVTKPDCDFMLHASVVWYVKLLCGFTYSVKLTITAVVYKSLKDVPTSIPKSDLLCVTMAVIHVAGQQFLAV